MEPTWTGFQPSPLGRRYGRRPVVSRGCDAFVPERRRIMLRTAPRVVALAILLGALSLGAPNAMAGTTGKLHGIVRGEKNEPLVGVNVRVEGQRLGPMTDDKGEYTIIGVPAGDHIVRANLLGYPARVAEQVTITADFSTDLNSKLKTE